MSCLDIPNRGLRVIYCVLILICATVSSCMSDNEHASDTSFRPVPYQPAVRQPYPTRYRRPYYGTPNSRSHYNPYEFQQPYGSNPYSDYDQYYVPPVQYYNTEYEEGVENLYNTGSPR